MRFATALYIAVFAAFWPAPLVVSAAAAERKVDFARQVQPIFAKHCYKCHGTSKNEGGLRLNSREAVLAELDSGEFAVVPKDIDASAIVHRVTSPDDDERMPPEGKPLAEDEVAAIRRWIEQGAEWNKHWAFRKPARPVEPTVKNSAWVRSPIDAFILSRLEAAGLQPAPPADKVALLRRAYYDLIGLPPTPEEVDAFVADDSPRAFEKVVDRLLESPQYGEKWARHWLDLVRYAETNGYERDSKKDLIWRYRDYVIRSFNQDKPYDRFILEQIAGDELPAKDAGSITATGFYRLGIWDDEPADRELARYDYLDDILRTTGETFLGMTIGCARCHDHKIDPILQTDYYSMISFFSDISPHGAGKTNLVPISTPLDQSEFDRKMAEKQKREMQLQEKIAAIESDFLVRLAKARPDLKIDETKSKNAGTVAVLPDSIDAAQEWEYTLAKPADNWFEIAFDDSQWKKGPGGFGTRGTPGSVVRTEWSTNEIWLRKDFGLEDVPGKLTVKIHHDEDAAIYLNGKLITTLTGYLTEYKTLDMTAESLDVLQTGRNTLAIHCRQTGGGQYIDAGLIADFSGTPVGVLVKQHGAEILGNDKLAELSRLRQELATSRAQQFEMKTEFAMAVAERGRNQTWVLGRGNPTMKGDEVGPAFPHILDPPAAEVPKEYDRGQTSGKRRVLAEWLASPDNVMTARVMVNRIWQHHFGRGIVRSTSDFGYQGTAPTHPELLDWLAAEFTDGGWRIKPLHKQIMLSAAYQMSSQANDEALARDPTNDLFWRYDMRRLTAEELRDSILAAVGTLNAKMYGPEIYPPLPAEVLATASRPDAAWGRSSPEEAARRSIYVHVKRSLRPPMMADFDVPDTDTACAVRVSTTVPTQALGMLNSKFMNEQAATLAQRLATQRPDEVAAQVALAIRLTTGRTPTESEVKADIGFIEQLQAEEKLSPQDALQLYCLMILNTNEFVYLD